MTYSTSTQFLVEIINFLVYKLISAEPVDKSPQTLPHISYILVYFYLYFGILDSIFREDMHEFRGEKLYRKGFYLNCWKKR
jgi:hypothetical protein